MKVDFDASSHRALVVDDEPLVRMYMCDILSDDGFHTIEAITADNALDVLRQHGATLELLVTDIEMPGKRNGFELARECAQIWPHIHILLIPGRTQSSRESAGH